MNLTRGTTTSIQVKSVSTIKHYSSLYFSTSAGGILYLCFISTWKDFIILLMSLSLTTSGLDLYAWMINYIVHSFTFQFEIPRNFLVAYKNICVNTYFNLKTMLLDFLILEMLSNNCVQIMSHILTSSPFTTKYVAWINPIGIKSILNPWLYLYPKIL